MRDSSIGSTPSSKSRPLRRSAALTVAHGCDGGSMWRVRLGGLMPATLAVSFDRRPAAPPGPAERAGMALGQAKRLELSHVGLEGQLLPTPARGEVGGQRPRVVADQRQHVRGPRPVGRRAVKASEPGLQLLELGGAEAVVLAQCAPRILALVMKGTARCRTRGTSRAPSGVW